MHDTPLARLYKTAADESPSTPTLELRLHCNPGEIPAGGAREGAHERQYNAPTSDNVGVLLYRPTDKAGSYDIVLRPHFAGPFQPSTRCRASTRTCCRRRWTPRATTLSVRTMPEWAMDCDENTWSARVTLVWNGG